MKEASTNNNIETEVKEEGKKKKERKKDKESLKENLLEQYKNDPSFSEFLKANKKGVEEEESAAVFAEQESSSEEEEEEEEKEDKLAQKKDISDQDVSNIFENLRVCVKAKQVSIVGKSKSTKFY